MRLNLVTAYLPFKKMSGVPGSGIAYRAGKRGRNAFLIVVFPRLSSRQVNSDRRFEYLTWFSCGNDSTMIAFLWVLLSFVIAVFVYRYWRRKVAFARNIPRLEPCYPIVGNLPLALLKNSNEIFTVLHDFFRKHDRLFTLHFGPLVAVGVTNPELIQKVLNHPDCQQKPDVYKVVRLPGGLLAAKCVAVNSEVCCTHGV